MANNVSFRVMFNEINQAAAEKLQELYGRFQDDDCNYGDMYVDGKEGSPTLEDTNGYGWYTDNLGTKWCFFGRSAWAAPEMGFFWLAEQLGELDENLRMTVSYEDESPNFAGWMVFDSVDMWEDDYKEETEIKNIVSRYCPDADVENDEEFYDLVWESINDWQQENFDRTKKEIIASRELQVD
jgi:hypothetical protein